MERLITKYVAHTKLTGCNCEIKKAQSLYTYVGILKTAKEEHNVTRGQSFKALYDRSLRL